MTLSPEHHTLVDRKRSDVHDPILDSHSLTLISTLSFRYPHSRTLDLSPKEVTIPHGGAVAADPIRTARYHISLIVGFDDINHIYRAIDCFVSFSRLGSRLTVCRCSGCVPHRRTVRGACSRRRVNGLPLVNLAVVRHRADNQRSLYVLLCKAGYDRHA